MQVLPWVNEKILLIWKSKQSFAQHTNICSKSAIEILEKGVKYVQRSYVNFEHISHFF